MKLCHLLLALMTLALCVAPCSQPSALTTGGESSSKIPDATNRLDVGNLASKEVLILHSFEGNAPVFTGTDKGISNILRSAGISGLNQFFHSLEFRRNPSSQYRKMLVEQMRMEHSHRKPDLIITMYPEALEFVLKDCRDIFSGIPVIALYLPRSFEISETDRLIVGHFPTPDITGTIEVALKLVPRTKRIYVVNGAHEVDKRVETQVRQISKKWDNKVEFVYLSSLPLEDILVTVSNTPPGSIILLLPYSQDVTGKNYLSPEVAQSLSQASSAPIFGILEATLGYGIIGGSLISFEMIGTRAGYLALDILRGAKASHNIPDVLDVPSVLKFDWRQLDRWGLAERNLPSGSVVINRPTTFWVQYRAYIIAGAVLLLVQTFLIFGLLVQRRRKQEAREMLSERSEQLNQFFNVSLDLLGVANSEGYFVRVNPSFEKVLGYTAEEFTSKPFLDFIHPEDRDATKEVMTRLSLQKSVNDFTNRYRCKDGTYRWLEWRSVPSGNTIYTAARDVTQKMRSAKELEERLDFEKLLSDLSARFVNVTAERVDSLIEEALGMLCEHLGFDLASVWQRSDPGSNRVVLTHLYRPLGGPRLPDPMDAEDMFPWCLKELKAGRIVEVLTEEAPREAARDQEMWRYYGIKSALTFPLSTGGGHFIGSLAFNNTREKQLWPEELVIRLQLVAQVFANALARKWSERALSESEERLSLASTSAGAGVWVLDLHTGRFWATNKALELLGLAPGHILEFDAFMTLVHPDDRERVLQAVTQVSQSDKDLFVEYRVILADNSIRWMVSRGRKQTQFPGKADQLMGVTLDITQRKEAEAAKAEAQSMVAALVESTDDLIWSVDPERFGLLAFNSALKEYFFDELGLRLTIGMRPEDMVTGPFTPLVAEKWRQFYLRALREGPFTEEYVVATGTRVLLLSFNVLKREGEVFGISVFGKDITEEKKVEAEAHAVRRELWRADRLLQMGELAGSLAHELNQPLTSILNNARAAIRFMKSDRLDNAELMEILEDIASDDKRAGDIIRSLRSMLRREESEEEMIGINGLLAETILLFNSEAVIRNIRIETKFTDLLPLVEANRVQLQQVVINLLMNAAESMMDVSGNRKILVETCLVDGNRVRVAVRDYGMGIDEHLLGSIFEPFFTTKHTGLGMGLSLVRSIIEAKAGHVWAVNNPDGGSTFYFELPGVRE